MSLRLLIIFSFFAANTVYAQSTFFDTPDSILKKRIIPVSIGIGSVWAGSLVGLSQIWYNDYDKTSFHTFDDGSNWLQMDKAGHIYTNYQISQFAGYLYKWSGMKSKKAALIGTCIGLGFQTTLELFDGFSSGWGFSWYDMGSNTLGAGIYLGQELVWEEQRFLLKFSYHPTEFAALRPEVLGSNFQEQLLKDYNGQTYWLSFNPFIFAKNSSFPKWICMSFGYSVNNKIIGDKETYIDPTNFKNYSSQREFICSLDIDFSRIQVQKKWLKTVLKQLNYLKIPFPALIIRDGKLVGSPLYF
jgi:hypothetical protein